MNRKAKKIIIIILFIIVGIFSVSKISYYNFKKDLNIKDSDYKLKVLFLVADKNVVPENSTIDEVYTKYNAASLTAVTEVIPLVKKDNYLYANISNFINGSYLKSIYDYSFTLNDLSGNVRNDFEYNEKTHELKIPYSYYQNKEQDIPVQMEFASRMQTEELKQIKFKTKTNGLITKTSEISANAFNNTTPIAIKRIINSQIKKSNIKIYINGSNESIAEDNYTIHKNIVTLNISPLMINKLNIKINGINNIFTNASAAVEAGSFSSWNSIKLTQTPNLNAIIGTLSNNGYLGTYTPNTEDGLYLGRYCGGNDGGMCSGNNMNPSNASYPYVYISANGNYYKSLESDGSVSNSYVIFPFGFQLNVLNWKNPLKDTYGIQFPPDFIPLACVNHTSSSHSTNFDVILNVTYIDSNYMILKITTTTATTQTGQAYVKLTWPEDNKAKLKVTKKANDQNGTTYPEGVNIGVYSDSSCSTLVKQGTTNSSGQVVFSDLTANTNYYIKELNLNDYKWVTEGCKNVYIEKDESTKTEDNYYYKETTYNNRARKYCLKVKKVDAENSSTVISGIKFSITNGTNSYEGTTGSDGIYTFNNLEKKTNDTTNGFTITETSIDGTNGYWNDSGNEFIANSELTEMVYSKGSTSTESGGTYSCPATAKTYTKQDHKQYYCIKVKKVDKNTKQLIKPATFKNVTSGEEHADGWDGSVDGYTTFFTGNQNGSFTVQETVAPQGYAVYNGTKTSTAFILPRELSRSQAEAECKNIKCTYDITTEKDTCRYTPTNSKTDTTNGDVIEGITVGTIPSFPDNKLLLNWYKEYESSGSKANDATFKVKNSAGKYIIVNGIETIKDASNPVKTKTCYKYSGLSNTMAGGSSLVSGANGANGEVCITGVDKGTYTIIETSPAPNHTFGSSITKDLAASTTFNDNQIFKNYGTYIEVEKKVTDDSRVSNILDTTVLYKIETNKLKKIPFEIYNIDNNGNATGNPKSFVLRDGIYYDLSSPDVSLQTGETATTTVYLNDSRRFKLSHLAWGKYVAKEKGHKDNGTCVCENESECIGYYYPKTDQEIKFEITKCSSSNSVSSGVANSAVGANTCAVTYTTLAGYQDNTPTELWFTKKDFYGYEDSADIASEEVDFVDDKERSDFDRIVFRVKDSNGNYLKFIDVGAHITDSDNVCLNDNDYREYRYITDEELSLLSEEERSQLTIVTDLHTCGGHIRITNLCRGKSYTVEEVSVPENSVFILPEKQEDRETTYKVTCCEDETTTIRTTQTIISDKGTRVTFEKRDSKYGYLIPDETTTFNVYQCKKGEECHPGDGITSDMKLMKFSPRTTIPNDEEDYGKEVYNAMSDTDVKSGKTFVTDLHPYKGDLILRYLPSGYNYVLFETVAPKNYALPKGRNAETSFTVVNDTVLVDEVDVPNKPTSLLIRKYSEDGSLLPGAEFKIYKVTTYDQNRTPENQEKVELKLKTIRDGVYDAREITDTNIIKTCKDNEYQKCSDINVTLTYDEYVTTWTNFENSVNQNNERVEIKEGEALIQYLEYGNYYVIEEVKAPNGYSLPKKSEDRFHIVYIEPLVDVVDTEKEFINKPTPFTFYKFDEYDRPLDGGKFKLQKLNEDKKYIDVPVTREEKEGVLYYKVDSTSNNTIIETSNGQATVYYLEEGQYRILEVEAPAGYELPKKTINVATFFVDSNGNVYGNAIITNKPKTETITYNPKAQAELIVNVQTGQTRIKYGLIIAVLVLAISGLIYIQREKSKKRGNKNEKE